MRKLLAVGAVLIAAQAASAGLVFYEPFNYNDAPAALSGHIDTNTTPNETWTKGGTSNEPKVSNGNLTYPGLADSKGNSALIAGAGNTSNSSLTRIPLGTDLTAAYYSMIVQIPTGGASMGANGASGSFFSGLQYNPSAVTGGAITDSGAGCAAALCIRPGGGDNANTTTYNLGIAFRDTATRVFDSTALHAGDTVLVVVKYNSNTSALTDARDDMASLYINPVSLGDADPNNPNVSSNNTAAGTIHDYFYTTAGVQLETNVRSIFLRDNTSEPTNIKVDEIRVGTTWADVTAVPEPASIGLLAIGSIAALRRRKMV